MQPHRPEMQSVPTLQGDQLGQAPSTHVLHAPQEPQVQLEPQVRERGWVPQLPQDWDSLPVAPALHEPSPAQVPQPPHDPQLQVPAHVRVRVRVPHIPQPSDSPPVAPAAHTPSPAQLENGP